MTLDAIAELWRQPELSLSTIGDRLARSGHRSEPSGGESWAALLRTTTAPRKTS
jgi:hypothetical protein